MRLKDQTGKRVGYLGFKQQGNKHATEANRSVDTLAGAGGKSLGPLAFVGARGGAPAGVLPRAGPGPS